MTSDNRAEDIRRRAFELYGQRGREDGHDWDDWFQAEDEINASTPQDTVSARRRVSANRRRSDRRAQLPISVGTIFHRAMSTGTGLRFRAPSATLPSSRRRTPLAPLAPTTSMCGRTLAMVPSRSRNGSPLVRVVRLDQPARVSCAAARSSSFDAAFLR